jgi:hypothetical protein
MMMQVIFTILPYVLRCNYGTYYTITSLSIFATLTPGLSIYNIVCRHDHYLLTKKSFCNHDPVCTGVPVCPDFLWGVARKCSTVGSRGTLLGKPSTLKGGKFLAPKLKEKRLPLQPNLHHCELLRYQKMPNSRCVW